MALAGYLLDTSALARLRLPSVEEVLVPMMLQGRLAQCGLTMLEALFSARSPADHRHLHQSLDRDYEWLATEDQDMRRAIEVQGKLAERGQLRAVPLPDLLIAAVAERHRVAVLHYDADYELIAQVTRQPMQWVVPRGSVS